MKPEEQIRQNLIRDMIDRLGFPKELIVIEKELAELPHLREKKVPKRRIDLVCFTKKGDILYPLLLVECKAIPLSDRALEQVFGYNYYVGARFVAIANDQGIIMIDGNGENVRHELLSYRELAGEESVSIV